MLNDLTRGTLLFLEEKSSLIDINNNVSKKFHNGSYCLYLGYSRIFNLHLLLIENRVFRLNGYGILNRTYIVQN